VLITIWYCTPLKQSAINQVMDEFQFIESLDALLANETIDETTTAAVELANSSFSNVHGQGILSGPTGPGQIGEINSNSWLGGNGNDMSSMDPFSMPLHSNMGLTANGTTSSVGSSSFQQYSSSTSADSMQKALGPILPTASSAGLLSASSLRAQAMNSTAVAPSEMGSVCSANSRGSSNASSYRRRGGSKTNNSTASVGSASSKSASRKRNRGVTSSMAVSDSEDEGFKRRSDRNLREQRRSQKITSQIDQLREVLAAASVRFKPDKYSTLVRVVDYVRELQGRSTMLDTEHKKLLDTITKTNDLVNEPYLANSGASSSSSTGRMGSIGSNSTKPDTALSGGIGGNANGVAGGGGGGRDIYNDDELVFVNTIDYKRIFAKCGMALAVASIDGRLMDCNHEFVELTGYQREELLPNEEHQKQQREEELEQQGSDMIDEVGSPFMSGSIFPDEASSSNNNKKQSDAHNGSETSSVIRTNNNAEIRNFSLFNLLSRNNMEEVFMSLSEMLKHPPKYSPKDQNGKRSPSKADYWSGNVRLSRNTHLKVSHRFSHLYILRTFFLHIIIQTNLTHSSFLFCISLLFFILLRCELMCR
jgi:PAS domain-containing protein